MPIPQLQIKGEPPRLPVYEPPELISGRTAKSPLKKAFFVILIFAVLIAPFLAAGAMTVTKAMSAKDGSEAAVAAIKNLDFDRAEAEIDDLAADLNSAKSAFRVFKLLVWMPWLGTQISAVDHSLSAAVFSAEAVRTALGFGKDIFSLARALKSPAALGTELVPATKSLGELSKEERRAILQKISVSAEVLTEIDSRLKRAEEEISRVPKSGVADALIKAIRPFAEKIREASIAAAAIRPWAVLLPEAVGYPKPKTYLFFLANNTELRPSAGFLGSYGILKMTDGEIESLVSDDIYNLDWPVKNKVQRAAPEPIKKYLGIDKLYLRDANWSPDFPESARTTMDIYKEEMILAGRVPENLDGVIAITPDLAKELLRITGSITVRGVTFTPDNLVEELEYQVEQAYLEVGTPITERKRIMGELVEEMVHRLTALPAGRWSEVADIFKKQIARKQVLFYSADESLEKLLIEQGLSGEIKTGELDYLAVIDANLAALKTDAVMRRNLSYGIAPDGQGNFVATVRVTYKNTGRFGLYTTRYRTYVRFYIPEGAELVSAEGQLVNDKLKNPKLLAGQVDVGAELGKTVFGMFTSIEPGETRTLVVKYRLPEKVAQSVKNGSYKLLIQKQSGSADYPLTLDLGFGKKVGRAAPAEAKKEWGDERYRLETALDGDKEFSVGF